MGWVSMREDQIERASEQLQEVRDYLAVVDATEEQKRVVNELLRQLEQVIAEAFDHVDLATDPQVDLVRRLVETEGKVTALNGEIQRLDAERRALLANWERKYKALEMKLEESREQVIAEKAKARQLRKDLKESRAAFEKLFSQHQSEAYDAFMDPAEVKRKKRLD